MRNLVVREGPMTEMGGLFDAHCHLGWFADPAEVAHAAACRGLGLCAVTVTPEEFCSLRLSLAGEKNVALAAGLHPWWVRDPSDADALLELVPDLRFIGEIGLDGAPRYADAWDAQRAIFERICEACAKTSDPSAPKVLSIHAVRSAGVVLDVLEQTGSSERCRCVLHWFSGTSDELARARELGCWFSIGERSLATRRGREYARQIPETRLLTETDLPEGQNSPSGADAILESLGRALNGIAGARGLDLETARDTIAANAAELLGI